MNYLVTYAVNGIEKTAVVMADSETEALNDFWLRYNIINGETGDNIQVYFVSELKYAPRIEFIRNHMLRIPEDKKALYESCK